MDGTASERSVLVVLNFRDAPVEVVARNGSEAWIKSGLAAGTVTGFAAAGLARDGLVLAFGDRAVTEKADDDFTLALELRGERRVVEITVATVRAPRGMVARRAAQRVGCARAFRDLRDLVANLQNLLLWGNQLSGSIPAQLGSLTNLEYFWVSFNQLSGNIPPQLGSLTDLLSKIQPAVYEVQIVPRLILPPV